MSEQLGTQSESEIKREICEYLEYVGALFTVSPPRRGMYSSRYMQAGWPDIYGIKGWSLPFFIEVKKPGGALSLEQHKILDRAKTLGAVAIVATCVQDVKDALKGKTNERD